MVRELPEAQEFPEPREVPKIREFPGKIPGNFPYLGNFPGNFPGNSHISGTSRGLGNSQTTGNSREGNFPGLTGGREREFPIEYHWSVGSVANPSIYSEDAVLTVATGIVTVVSLLTVAPDS